ncbi:efflux RND transporter periplasmic adaptor subunit [Deinococcus roseus]|uniref:RND transporter n=1 Tax=Deinococcus roseus TaxID=392414 RepID=A0ABQ2DAW3_9DEIO|nr:efflux RND transporter periplasmic adaptor subunit [Deinococcus roseus]GGJ51913.1 RND transporter [Deinococcus roseus]
MNRKMRGLLTAGTVLLVLGGGGGYHWYRTSKAQQSTQTATTVQTAEVSSEQFKITVDGSGSLAAVQSFAVKSEVSGILTFKKQVGDRVKKGELVAEISADTYQRGLTDAQISLQKAELQLASTRTSLQSSLSSQQSAMDSAGLSYTGAQNDYNTALTTLNANQKIYNAGGISAQALQDSKNSLIKAESNLTTARLNLESARASISTKNTTGAQDLKAAQLAVQQAEITVKTAKDNLALTRIYAPISGVVSSLDSSTGSTVGNSSGILTLQDDSKIKIPVQVDETEISKVKTSQKVEITLDAVPDQTFEGTVTQVDPSATISSNIAVYNAYVLIENQGGLLKPGMSAEASIVILDLPVATVVSSKAIQQVRERSYVEVQKEDGSKEMVRVRTGAEDGTNTVITSGLEPGQKVIVPTTGTTSTASSSTANSGNTQRQNQSGLGIGGFGGGPGGPP